MAQKNAERINNFAINLFKKEFENNVENFCISPVSVFYTFAMMANGDDRRSRDEILDILGYPKGEEGLYELNIFANALLRETTQFEGETQFGFTNSIWHRPSISLLPKFCTDIKDIYGGMIHPIWLGDENGRTAINTFVYNQTRGITNTFLNNTDITNLTFVNTPYFTGSWKIPFSNESGEKKQFDNYYGAYTQTSFLSTSACEIESAEIEFPSYDYLGSYSRRIRIIRLPYEGDNYTMTIIQPIPFTIRAFEDLLKALDNDALTSYGSALCKESIRLWIPKFKSVFNKDILPTLISMGFYYVRTQGLSKISDEVIVLRKFPHAVTITVDEPNTTRNFNAIQETSRSKVDATKTLLVNSPFVYMIQDTLSGSILLIGVLINFK
ncbi:MAG: serpin family protein [Muribaculaceae bacterium]|nr:serpin family protein [Muribaculaceae bacterium]